MTTDNPTPRRIEWTAPEGWTIWADEDGAHLRTPNGDCLEAPDVRRLIDLYNAVCDAMSSGTIPAPKPPTKEQVKDMRYDDRARYMAKQAARAVIAELVADDAPVVPF